MAIPVLLQRPVSSVLAKSMPSAGQRIKFLSDALTDKGPATGEVVGVKTTVDGAMVTVRFADGQQTFSWEDLDEAGADVRGDLWLVKAHRAIRQSAAGHPAVYPGAQTLEERRSGKYVKRAFAWRGLTVRVENEAGTERHFPGGSVRLVFAYGELQDTEGVDGDPVDVILGPSLDTCTHVFVVHQRRVGRWDEYDEDKCMVGFLSEEEAAQAFMANYDDPRFLGPITTLPVEEFVAKARATRERPSMIKSWFGEADLLKATLKKTITVPGYYKADGTFVPPHQKAVHYNAEHDLEAVANGGVSHSQKQAHAKLSKEDWFHKLDTFERASHVMAHATELQDAASASAAVSGWKAAAKAGKNPTASQWAAFQALPSEKKAALFDEVMAVTKGFDHLKPPKEESAAPPPPMSPEAVINLSDKIAEQAKAAEEEKAKHEATAVANAKANDELEAIAKSGAHYQKEALKKLSGDAGFKNMDPVEKLHTVMDLYKQLQGAASQSAAVSMWKKQLLAGKHPSGAQVAAYQALAASDHKKAAAIAADIVAAIGADKFIELTGDSAPAAAPKPEPVNTTAQQMGATVKPIPDPFSKPEDGAAAGIPAFDWLSASKHKGLDPVPLGSQWLKENPGKLTELYEAMQSLGHGDAAAHKAIAGASTFTPAAAPAQPKKTAYDYAVIGANVHGLAASGSVIKNASLYASQGKLAELEAIIAHLPAMKQKTKDSVQAILDAAKKDHGVASEPAPAKPPRVASVKPTAEMQQQAYIAEKSLYTNVLDGHNKQWAVHVAPAGGGKWHMVTEYGPIGKTQQSTTKVFDTYMAAHEAMLKLKWEKVKGGYNLQKKSDHKVMVPTESVVSQPQTPKIPAPPEFKDMHGSVTFHNSVIEMYKHAEKGSAENVSILLQSLQGLNAPASQKAWLYGVKALKAMGAPKPSFVDGSDWSGPEDGDTKPAADGGSLVFKDGYWHKQEQPAPAAKKLSDADIVAALAHAGYHSGGPNNQAIKDAKAAAQKGDAAALQALLDHTDWNGKPKTKKAVQKMLEMVGGKAQTRTAKPTPAAAAAAAAPAPTKATPEPTAPPATAAPSPASKAVKPGQAQPMDDWKKVGEQKGSNAGGTFQDKMGGQWYCKFPGSEDVARNEVLAAKFYQMLGVKVPFVKLVRKDGKLGIASKIVDGLKKTDASGLAKAKGTHEGFIFDAWMGNWDVIGMSNDNLLVDKDGNAVRVDPGGALIYRAQGGKKTDFGGDVPELETMLDAKKNPKAAAVFAGVGKAAIDAGVAKLNMLKPSQITELVQLLGPGTAADKQKLAQTLMERRAFILKKFGVVDQWDAQKKLDQTKLPVNAKDLPKPIDFVNFNGPGKGLSSKAWLNEQNSKDSAALVAFAAKGNLTALKDYHYEAVDKETGKSLGKKPITSHPSNKVQEQWAGLVELLQSIYAPSLPTLDMPSMGSVSALEEISDFVGSFSPTERPETVATEHRLGFFMALNQIDDIHDLVKDMKWSFIQKGGGWVSKMKAGFASLSALTRKYISSVQASGSINHVWSQGKSQAAGVGVNKLAAEIYKNAVDIPEGTVLRRGMTDTTAGKAMMKQLLSAKPGLVIQNTDSMCTSFNETHSWGGDIQMTIRCAKGCKATPSFASGAYSSEYEITTLPGQRYVILSTKQKTGGGIELEVLMLPPHQGYVAELGKLSALGKALQSVVLFIRKVVS